MTMRKTDDKRSASFSEGELLVNVVSCVIAISSSRSPWLNRIYSSTSVFVHEAGYRHGSVPPSADASADTPQQAGKWQSSAAGARLWNLSLNGCVARVKSPHFNLRKRSSDPAAAHCRSHAPTFNRPPQPDLR